MQYAHIVDVPNIGYHLVGIYEKSIELPDGQAGYIILIEDSDIESIYQVDEHTGREYSQGQKLVDDFDYDTAIANGLVDRLWINTKALLSSHFDDAASGFIIDQKNAGGEKAAAAYGWYLGYWAAYYSRKATILGGDFSGGTGVAGTPPFSMGEIMLEAAELVVIVE